MNDGTKTRFAFYNDIRNTHLTTQSGEEDDEFDWVYIVGDNDEGCFFCFDESDTVVETVLDEERFLGVLWSQSLQGMNVGR